MRLCSALAALAMLAPGDARAGQATCSNPGLPIGARASSDLMPGQLTLALTSGLLSISGSEVVDETAGPIRYDSRLVLAETRLSAEYAITRNLAVGLGGTYRIVDVGVDYFDPATGAPVTNGSSIHIRDERLTGLGDVTLQGHYAREVAGGLRVHARLGTTIPVGSTEENPHLLGQIGQEHQHVQLGTGTFVPFIAAEVQRAFGSVTAAVFGLAYVSLYENHHAFEPGHRISGGVTAASSFGLRALTFGAAAEVHGETAETWAGLELPDEGNNGRLDTLLGLSVAWRPLATLALVADAKVPVYSKVWGSQLDYGPVFGLGVVATFETRARPSYAGLDAQTIGARGTAPPLVPVPGKITVFDLWAAWCAPCRELDERLLALAKRFPDRLAIRKLDVVDDDSAAWATYLAPGGHELPHVKVYGTDGALVFERSAPPAALVQAIEALLAK